MYLPSLLLALAATASAIDIRAYTGDNCAGGYVACVNINPNVCCSFSSVESSVRSSIAMVAIPSSWNIRAESYTGGGCKTSGGLGDSDGSATVCLPQKTWGDRTGGKYWFPSRKRADLSCPADQPDAGKCEAVVKPDTLGLADGTEYNIAGLSDEEIQKLDKIASSGAGADAVPAEFQALSR
ncbi:uncharacterized protein CTRU02_208488 [Colletotrichum truncatum]|uniref:Uncharacterized protein n=1 Tax=Colletotrichum truncatum TaxID=5467 RepID=A0ACC3YWE5_COLTU|nr:uncharacterized protein CTRU02_10242 [Colletotrichum truncatum]KAF6787446.1 hypothetical protein CTRU02_10242 [Colletotrichum truncatum]